MPEGNVLYALLLTLGAGLATGLGGVIILFTKNFSPRFLSVSMGFSAGVMIFISFVELFADARGSLAALHGDKMGMVYALLAFFGGMALIAIIDNLVPSNENPHEVPPLTLEVITHKQAGELPLAQEHPLEKIELADESGKNSKKLLRVGILSSIVIAVHNFPEGIATFVSAMEDPSMGISIAFAIALHNIPEGIAIAIPIYYATRSKARAVTNATLSGLAEPAGALLGYFLLRNFISDSFLGIILAAVAGIMVYISLDELLPTAENYGEHHIAIMGVIAGMAFMGFGLLLF